MVVPPYLNQIPCIQGKSELLLMAQTCQCPIIPGMCPFVFLAAFVQSQRVNCYEVTNEGIDLTARTSI